MGKYSSEKDKRSNLKVDPSTWSAVEDAKDAIRRRTGKRPGTNDVVLAGARLLVTDSEQARVCALCKSLSYVGCSHVEIAEIRESVLKTENIGDEKHSESILDADERSLIETWRRARDVGFVEWKEMLLSIRRQMELVARAADREKELMAMAERDAAKVSR